MVYDCFTFFNELDLLEIRLNLLDKVVDKFVLVEMDKTQTGQPKDYFFEINKERYSRWKEKIIHIKVKAPSFIPQHGNWKLEHFQRNSILEGLKECEEDDIIMISDLDEFPNPDILNNMDKKTVTWLRPSNGIFFSRGITGFFHQFFRILSINPFIYFKSKKLHDVLDSTPVILEQDNFSYYMNCRLKRKWHATVMFKFKKLILPNNCRKLRAYFPVIKNGGWHFSYLGGLENVVKKVNSIVEGKDYIMEENINNEQYIFDCIKNGKDLYGRTANEFRMEIIPIGELKMPGVSDVVKKYPDFFFHGDKNA